LPACNRNAKIKKQLNFELEAQGIRAMAKCPRCNLEQEDSPQCEYCGLVFEAFMETTEASKITHSKLAVMIVIIIVVAGALFATYLLISHQDKPGEKSASAEHSSDLALKTNGNDLRTTVKELSGDVGILNDLTGGYTKGSIIAMIIFSVIGLGYFAYGKKSQQFLMLLCGIALMGYSYFVDGTGYIILIGVGLIVLPFILGRK
jgi:hypothetical protein